MTTADAAINADPPESGPCHAEFIDPCTDSRWDSFVASHPYGWLTHLSAWKRIIEGSFPHMKGHYPALVDQSDGTIAAALPVFEVKSTFLGNRLVSMPFASLADPLVTSPTQFHTLAETLIGLANRLRAAHVEIRTHHAAPLIKEQQLGARLAFKIHNIALDRDLEELKHSFHRSCVRSRITKALGSGMVLKVGESEDDLKELYRLYRMMRKRVGLPPQPYTFLQMIWATLRPENRVELLLAEMRGKTVAAHLLFKFKDRVSAEFAVMDNDYQEVSPNHFLFWEAIKRSSAGGYKVFDFGRTASSNQSLTTFKERWGTAVHDLPVFYFPRTAIDRTAARENSLSRRLLGKVCTTAPDYLLTHIGQFCYRHMG